MSDADVATDAQGPQGPPSIRILAQYIRDLSFENPRAPASLVGGEAPKIDLEVELSAARIEANQFQLDMKLSVGAARNGETVFQVELVYGGVFQLDNVGDADLEPIVLMECPRYLFPFARQIIANVVADGGFPPFRMEPLDFAGIYMARQQQLAQETGNA
jgi:preprotein translocase subunit SecB